MLRILLLASIILFFDSATFAQLPNETVSALPDSDTTKAGFPDRLLGSRLSPTIDLRAVDGISLGLAYKITGKTYEKEHPGSFQKIKALHSLFTKSLVVEYGANFKNVFKQTDLSLKALADIQGNIMNFFGPGNDTEFDETGDFRKFYRVNFSYYEFKPVLRFNLSDELSITTGPSIQHFVVGSNEGRYFNTPAVSPLYNDLYGDKLHGGLSFDFNWDRRDDQILPTKGTNLNIILLGFEGLNSSSQSFAQAFSQFSIYKSLDANGTFVIANRLGGGMTSGNPAFYQSAFLGSEGNLLGFRKNRFAGDHVLYNNLEARITVPNFLEKLMPGKMGLIGAYDAGRVWNNNETSDTIHHSLSAGVFLTPFNKFFIRGTAGFSNERLQPTVAFRQRF
jgi:hypothetical protein